MNPDGKLQWANYTSQFGDGKRDPRAHTVEFLQGFFQAMDEGSIEVGGVPDESTKNEIFVGGLPQDIPEADVRVYFEGWGPILKLEHKQGKGFAFVTFEDEVTVQAILDNHASHEINGKWVDCKRAENRQGLRRKKRRRTPRREGKRLWRFQWRTTKRQPWALPRRRRNAAAAVLWRVLKERRKRYFSRSFLPLRARPLLLWILLTRKYLSSLGYSPLRENGRDPLPLPRDRSTRSQGAIFKAGLLFWVFFSFKVTKKKYQGKREGAFRGTIVYLALRQFLWKFFRLREAF